MPDLARVDEGELSRLVAGFYTRVRADEMLGPVFNQAVGDWPDHLKKLTAFWSSIMLTSGRYKGNPMAVHLKHLARITPGMFDRWLALWAETTAEIVPLAAPQLQAKAARIAESLKLGLFFKAEAAHRHYPAPA
jgi:hemoglobin